MRSAKRQRVFRYSGVSTDILEKQTGTKQMNGGSVSELEFFVMEDPYVASKHGVIGLTESAVKGVADRAIRVNDIAPGTINTPMVRKFEVSGDDLKPAGIPLGKEGNPGEVAELITWLLNDSSSYITGTAQVVNGGMLALKKDQI